MKVPSILIRGILAGFFVCGGVGAANADEILRAKLRYCAKDGTTFGDVGSCGKVWKLGSGEAKPEADGKIKVEVKSLVLNDASTGEFNGTPDGVTGLVAALICGGNGGTVAAQTAGVPLSQAGDAKDIRNDNLLERCVAPVIVVREIFVGAVGGWLAGAGF